MAKRMRKDQNIELNRVLRLPQDFAWSEREQLMASSVVRNWIAQYGEEVVGAKRRGFLLTLANYNLPRLRNYA